MSKTRPTPPPKPKKKDIKQQVNDFLTNFFSQAITISETGESEVKPKLREAIKSVARNQTGASIITQCLSDDENALEEFKDARSFINLPNPEPGLKGLITSLRKLVKSNPSNFSEALLEVCEKTGNKTLIKKAQQLGTGLEASSSQLGEKTDRKKLIEELEKIYEVLPRQTLYKTGPDSKGLSRRLSTGNPLKELLVKKIKGSSQNISKSTENLSNEGIVQEVKIATDAKTECDNALEKMKEISLGKGKKSSSPLTPKEKNTLVEISLLVLDSVDSAEFKTVKAWAINSTRTYILDRFEKMFTSKETKELETRFKKIEQDDIDGLRGIRDELTAEEEKQETALRVQIKASEEELKKLRKNIEELSNDFTGKDDLLKEIARINNLLKETKSPSDHTLKERKDLLGQVERGIEKLKSQLQNSISAQQQQKQQQFKNRLEEYQRRLNDFKQQLKKAVTEEPQITENDKTSLNNLQKRVGDAQQEIQGMLGRLNTITEEDVASIGTKTSDLEREIKKAITTAQKNAQEQKNFKDQLKGYQEKLDNLTQQVQSTIKNPLTTKNDLKPLKDLQGEIQNAQQKIQALSTLPTLTSSQVKSTAEAVSTLIGQTEKALITAQENAQEQQKKFKDQLKGHHKTLDNLKQQLKSAIENSTENDLEPLNISQGKVQNAQQKIQDLLNKSTLTANQVEPIAKEVATLIGQTKQAIATAQENAQKQQQQIQDQCKQLQEQLDQVAGKLNEAERKLDTTSTHHQSHAKLIEGLKNRIPPIQSQIDELGRSTASAPFDDIEKEITVLDEDVDQAIKEIQKNRKDEVDKLSTELNDQLSKVEKKLDDAELNLDDTNPEYRSNLDLISPLKENINSIRDQITEFSVQPSPISASDGIKRSITELDQKADGVIDQIQKNKEAGIAKLTSKLNQQLEPIKAKLSQITLNENHPQYNTIQSLNDDIATIESEIKALTQHPTAVGESTILNQRIHHIAGRVDQAEQDIHAHATFANQLSALQQDLDNIRGTLNDMYESDEQQALLSRTPTIEKQLDEIENTQELGEKETKLKTAADDLKRLKEEVETEKNTQEEAIRSGATKLTDDISSIQQIIDEMPEPDDKTRFSERVKTIEDMLLGITEDTIALKIRKDSLDQAKSLFNGIKEDLDQRQKDQLTAQSETSTKTEAETQTEGGKEELANLRERIQRLKKADLEKRKRLLGTLAIIQDPLSSLSKHELERKMYFLLKVMGGQSDRLKPLKNLKEALDLSETPLSTATQEWSQWLREEAVEAKNDIDQFKASLEKFNDTDKGILQIIDDIHASRASYQEHAKALHEIERMVASLEKKDPIHLRPLATPEQLDTQFRNLTSLLETERQTFVGPHIDSDANEMDREHRETIKQIKALLEAAVEEKPLKLNFEQVEKMLPKLHQLKQSENAQIKSYAERAEIALANADLQTPLIATFATQSTLIEAPKGYLSALPGKFAEYSMNADAEETSYAAMMQKASPTDDITEQRFRENTIPCADNEKIVYLEGQVGKNRRSDLVSLPKHLIPEKFWGDLFDQSGIDKSRLHHIAKQVSRNPNALRENDILEKLLKSEGAKNPKKLASEMKKQYLRNMTQEYDGILFPNNELIQCAMHQVRSHIAVTGKEEIRITHSYDWQYATALYSCASAMGLKVYDMTGLLASMQPRNKRGIVIAQRDRDAFTNIAKNLDGFKSLLATDPLTKSLYEGALRNQAAKQKETELPPPPSEAPTPQTTDGQQPKLR